MKKSVLVLDAMGVIYQSADDVVELLAPFIKNKGGISDLATVEKLYVRASLGELSAVQFWVAVGVSPCWNENICHNIDLPTG